MADDTLQRLFQQLQDTSIRKKITGNESGGYAQTYAPYDAYFANARQMSKENKSLALQKGQLALGEKGLATQERLYNKAAQDKEKWGYINLAANVAGTGAGLWAKSKANESMERIFGTQPALAPNDFKMTSDLLHPTTEGQYMLPAATRLPDPNARYYDMANTDIGSKGALIYDPATMGGTPNAPSFWDNIFSGEYWTNLFM